MRMRSRRREKALRFQAKRVTKRLLGTKVIFASQVPIPPDVEVIVKSISDSMERIIGISAGALV